MEEWNRCMEKATGGKIRWWPPARCKGMQNVTCAMFCCRELSSAIRNSEICEHNFQTRINHQIKALGLMQTWNALKRIQSRVPFQQCATTFPIQLEVFLESYCDASYFWIKSLKMYLPRQSFFLIRKNLQVVSQRFLFQSLTIQMKNIPRNQLRIDDSLLLC